MNIHQLATSCPNVCFNKSIWYWHSSVSRAVTTILLQVTRLLELARYNVKSHKVRVACMILLPVFNYSVSTLVVECVEILIEQQAVAVWKWSPSLSQREACYGRDDRFLTMLGRRVGYDLVGSTDEILWKRISAMPRPLDDHGVVSWWLLVLRNLHRPRLFTNGR